MTGWLRTSASCCCSSYGLYVTPLTRRLSNNRRTISDRLTAATPGLFQCVPVHNMGFSRGSYICNCSKGYYFPLSHGPQYYNGSQIEEEYDKKMRVSELKKSEPNSVARGCIQKNCPLVVHVQLQFLTVIFVQYTLTNDVRTWQGR